MAAWVWFGLLGVVTNLAAIALLWAGLRTRVPERLRLRRALSCAVVATFGSGLGVLPGLVTAVGAVGGQAARRASTPWGEVGAHAAGAA